MRAPVMGNPFPTCVGVWVRCPGIREKVCKREDLAFLKFSFININTNEFSWKYVNWKVVFKCCMIFWNFLFPFTQATSFLFLAYSCRLSSCICLIKDAWPNRGGVTGQADLGCQVSAYASKTKWIGICIENKAQGTLVSRAPGQSVCCFRISREFVHVCV